MIKKRKTVQWSELFAVEIAEKKKVVQSSKLFAVMSVFRNALYAL